MSVYIDQLKLLTNHDLPTSYYNLLDGTADFSKAKKMVVKFLQKLHHMEIKAFIKQMHGIFLFLHHSLKKVLFIHLVSTYL